MKPAFFWAAWALVRVSGQEVSDRLAALERKVAALERRTDACEDEIPLLERTPLLLYGGCNRNVHRDATQSVETCQNGTVAFSNASGTRSTGLFDAKIANDVDAWNFVCAFGIDRPHEAACTLTFEEPARAEGPAWVQMRFTEVLEGASDGACVAGGATIVGTYFYDSLTSDAGVYVFYARPLAEEEEDRVRRPPKRSRASAREAERGALSELARATAVDGWVRRGGWLAEGLDHCDWDNVGCDSEGRVTLLAMSFNNMRGALPEHAFAPLTRLQDLDLEYNSLVGSIPASLGSLPRLMQLGLGGNAGLTTLPAELCTTLERIVAAANGTQRNTAACDLSHGNFECPLPCDVAKHCGATCISSII